MSENSENDATSPLLDAAASAGIARRKLIRAGLVAAPVMLALKSQSALATGTPGHCMPSVWASFKASPKVCLSHGVTIAGGTCNSHVYWKDKTSYPNFCNDHTKTRFHDYSSSGKYCPPFDGTKFGSKNLKEICNLTETDEQTKLAKHCTAIFLNCKAGYDSPIDATTCRNIWKSGGVYTPAPGATPWNINQCNDYFDFICGIPNPRNPPFGIPACT